MVKFRISLDLFNYKNIRPITMFIGLMSMILMRENDTAIISLT